MTEEEIKLITPEKHLGCVAQGQQFAALMKKRKEEILRNKEQSRVPSTEQSTEQSSVQSSLQPLVQPTVQSNDAYIYGVGIVAVPAVGVYVFFTYNASQAKNKKPSIKKNKINHQNDVICFRKNI